MAEAILGNHLDHKALLLTCWPNKKSQQSIENIENIENDEQIFLDVFTRIDIVQITQILHIHVDHMFVFRYNYKWFQI